MPWGRQTGWRATRLGSGERERVDMGKVSGKGERRVRHLKGRAPVNLVLSGPAWSTNPSCPSLWPLQRHFNPFAPGPPLPLSPSTQQNAIRPTSKASQAKEIPRLQCLPLPSRHSLSSTWSVPLSTILAILLIVSQPLPPVSASEATFGLISSLH